MKNLLLYFGSFNPTHNGHIALAEYAIEHNLCDEVAFVVSPQNPLKNADELAPNMDRFEMAEIACAASRYPERIKASLVEFLLDRPSYTIQTLRYLQQTHAHDMTFSILMGADLVQQLDRWKEYDQIVGHYNIYVYPRRDVVLDKFCDQITYLSEAPLCDFSSTRVREAVENGEPIDTMVCSGVADYIRNKALWNPAARIATLTAQIEAGDATTTIYIERGKLYYRHAEWGKALNDFNAALRIDAEHSEARELAGMVEEILAFRYKDIYNP
ncbi:MAG: nicotinate (nicotinamide) nucleotide adenylyltransferase [Alistipes sp.]